MSDLQSQIRISADASGVEAGVSRAKRSLADLGKSASDAGKRAAGGLSGVGEGGEKSARQIKAATREIERDLQKQIAAFKAGEKGSRAYLEELAKIRGADMTRLQPLLNQLDAFKGKASAAETAARGMAAALAAVGGGAVFIAAVKSAIDLGDRLDDLAEKTGISARELSVLRFAGEVAGTSFDSIADGVRKLSQNMASAAGGGKEQAAAFKAIGVEVKNLDGSLRASDAVLADIADRFSNFRDGPEKAALAIELFGKQGAEMIPLLNKGSVGIAELRDEATALGVVMSGELASSAAEFNDNLKRLQLTLGGSLTQLVSQFLPTLNEIAQAMTASARGGDDLSASLGGGVRNVLQAVSVLAANVAFVFKSMGREIGAVAAQAVALATLDLDGFRAISDAVKEDGRRARAELDALERRILSLGTGAGAGRGAAADPRALGPVASIREQTRAWQTAAPVIKKVADEADRLKKATADPATIEAVRAYADAMGDFAKIASESATKADGLTKAQARLRDLQASPVWEQYGRQQREQVMVAFANARAEEDRAAAVEASTKAIQAARAEYEKYVTTQQDAVDKLREQVEEERESLAAIGLSRTALAELAAAKLDVAAATKIKLATEEEERDGDLSLARLYREQAASLTKLADLKRQSAAKQVATDAAKEAADSWQKFADDLYSGLTDSLYRGFEAGKGFFKSFWDGIKNTLKTTVLKVAVQGVMNMSGLGSILGQPGFAGAASGLGNLAGFGGIIPFNPILNAGAFGGGLSAGFGALFGEAGLSGALSAGTTAIGAGNILGGLGTLAGALGPIAAGVGLIASLVSKDRGGPKESSAFNYGTEGTVGDAAKAIADAMQAAFAPVAQALGLASTTLNGLGIQFAKDPKGTAMTQFDATIPGYSRGGRLGSTENVGRSDEAFQQEVADETVRVIFVKLAQSLSGRLGDYLKELDVSAPAAELQKRIDSIVGISRITPVLEQLGANFANLANVSPTVTAAVLDAAGGFDKLAAGSASFLENFLSETEKQDLLWKSLVKTFQAAGVVLPANREAYKATLQSLDLTTEEGRKTAAVLLENADAFAQLYPAVDQLGGSVGGLTENLTQAVERLRNPARTIQDIAANLVRMENEANNLSVAFMRANGDTAGADALQRQIETAGFTEAEIAHYDYLQSIRDAIALLDAAKVAQEEANRRAEAIAQERAGLERQLLELQGNTNALRALERASLDETNRALFDQITALQDQQTAAAEAARLAEEAAQAQAAIAQERAGLESQLLQLQGNTVALRALEREKLDASNRALYDQITALQDSQAAAQAAAQAEAQLASQRAGLENAILQLEGNTQAIRARELAALDASLRPLQERIYALQDEAAAAQEAARAAEAAAQAEAQLASQRQSLQLQLLEAQGNTQAVRDIQIAALDPSLRSLQTEIWNVQDAAKAAAEAERAIAEAQQRANAILSERQGLEARILQLEGNTAGLRALELEKLDPSNRALQLRIFQLEDEAEAVAKANAISEEREGLQRQLLSVMGDTAAIRALELAQLDPSNRALQEQIWALQDQQEAAEEAARAAEQLRSAWASLADSIFDTVDRIRGDMAGEGAAGFARAQSQFAIATAAARAGDQEAAANLPKLADVVLRLGEGNAASLVDLRRLQGQVAASLEQTGQLVSSQFGVTPGSTTVSLPGGIPATGASAQHQQAASLQSLVEEIKALKAEVIQLKTEAKRTADVVDGGIVQVGGEVSIA